MSQMVFWMLGIAFCAATMMFTVALDAHLVEFALSAIITTFISISAVRDFHASQEEAPLRRSAILLRHMGLLWCWAAMSLTLIYSFLLQWSAWRGVFFVTALGAGLCLFIANLLDRDAADGVDGSRMNRLVDIVAKVQFGATCVAVGGLVAMGKLSVSAFGGEAKWAAVNILLCMGLALAGLSGFSIASAPAMVEETASGDANGTQPSDVNTTAAQSTGDGTNDPAFVMPVIIPASRLRQATRSA